MTKLLKALILTIPLFMASNLAFADACGEATQSSNVVTTLTDECKQQLLGFEASIDNINKIFQANNSPSGLDVVTGKFEGDESMSDSTLLMLHGIGILSAVVMVVLAAVFLIGIATNIWNARKQGDNKSFMGNGAAYGNAIKMAMKAPFFATWTFLIVLCLAGSLSGMCILMYNIMVQNTKSTQLTYSSYAAASKAEADKIANNDINALYKYASCVIDHDKRIIFDNAVNPDYTLNHSDYLSCMSSKSSVLDESKNSFISRHLYRVQDCGMKHANVSNANCGSINFKIDAQHVLKDKFIDFEDRLLTAANDVRDYLCLNQPITDKDAEIKNSCWKYNPVTSQIFLNGEGKIGYVTTSKSYEELKQTKNSLRDELSEALQSTARENFKTYVPVKKLYTVINYIKSKFTENDLVRAVKNYNAMAMDYDVSYVDEFQYKKVMSSFNTLNNFIDGGTSTTTVYNKEVEKIIDSLTQKTTDELIKDMIFSMADFMGSGYASSLGAKYEAGGDYNIVSATIISGQQTATYLIVTSIALDGVKGGLSMLGTRSLSGKPDMKMVLLEKTMGFFAGYMKAFGLAIAGATIGLVLLIISTIVSQVTAIFENVVKIAFIYEISFVMAGIDDKDGRNFNHDDISRRLITLLYVLLIFMALVIEFELIFQVSYLLLDFAKDNFYIINKTAGYVVESGNTLMSVVYGYVVIFAFHIIVLSTMMMGLKTVNQKFHAALIQKLFGSQDLKSGLLLEDQQAFRNNTEGHFGSMAKNARTQRI